MIPAAAERAMRRRIQARFDAKILQNHRTRFSRKNRHILCRSRSAGPHPKQSTRFTYERSHSCPNYPVAYPNTYKITENKRDYIFQVDIPNFVKTVHRNCDLIQCKESKRTLPKINHIEEYIDQNTKNRKSTYYFRSNSLSPDANHYENCNKTTIHDPIFYSSNNKSTESIISIKSPCNINDYNELKNYKNLIEKHTNENLVKNIEVFNEKNVIESENKTSPYLHRKNQLSLDLKLNYDSNILNNFNEKESQLKYNGGQHDIKLINGDLIKKNKQELRRRHSDSVFIKCSTISNDGIVTYIEDSQNACSQNAQSENKNLNSTTTNVNDNKTLSKESLDMIFKKYTCNNQSNNVVSIKETPSIEEYRDLYRGDPQHCVDLSCKEPLPSIIKNKARIRSYSVASAGNLDREVCIIANSVAFSPLNLGSPRRVCTPVVTSNQSLDDHHDSPPNITSNRRRTSSAVAELKTIQSMANQKRNQCNVNRNKKSSGKKSRGKIGTADGKRSNDYGGRENGRGGSQPQPLERRESRRGQFTRSLSNADVPPDEKTGN